MRQMSEIEVRFIRHAKGSHMLTPDLIAGRSMDATLIDEGWRQASAKGRELALRAINPDRVVSSPAIRCVQTTEAILDAMGIKREVELADELLEMDQGEFAGRKRLEVYTEEVLRQIDEEGKDFKLPGGESMNMVGERGTDWLRTTEGLLAQEKLSVFAIAHAGLITHTVGAIVGWDQPTSLAMLRSMPPVGETRVVFDGKDWDVDYFARRLEDF